ncbi:MAG: hypothetical protein ABIF04_04550, partial [Chloroflexota bacterium]
QPGVDSAREQKKLEANLLKGSAARSREASRRGDKRCLRTRRVKRERGARFVGRLFVKSK